MIDLHSHILPGIDDGADSLEESVELARLAVKEGIQTLYATPHHKNGSYENSRISILQSVDTLNQVLRDEQIPLRIMPGQEIRIHGEMAEEVEKAELLPIGIKEGQYLLVELPSGHVPAYTKKVLFDIQLQGITPIIVHPERNAEIIERPHVLFNLVDKGALTQVTASSLAGYFGKKIKRFSQELIAANLTHFIASDAHNIKNRSFNMVHAYDEIEKEFGIDMIYFFKENAESVLLGESVYKEMPQQIKTKKFLGIF
ncbi:protein-tyrosine phosphatase [Peribacillus deserti]|uniref:Tyrosine-protein phosphatase n=1 Tax=Peribacillus deserti TaxID=673318 RepID=A0ABS2QC78_9BACI|nr:CpsB/CapC family capsule biosynthesis tyrosine phosphatase [Peribacillus deserti]MBM7690771.1 protein-tyrosine phosphatase [Peribacillus deserti]